MGNYKDLSPTDIELLQRLAFDDENAFTILYYRYADRLFSFAVRLSGSPTEAADLVQDVFAKVWERRRTFTGDEIFTGYLFSMIHNHCINFLKRFSKKNKILQEFNIIDVNTETADSLLFYKEATGILQNTIKKLPPRQQQIFHLHHDEGLKYSEIASNLNLSQSTVENHYNRALKMLKKYLRISID